jgi:hypothetical protein
MRLANRRRPQHRGRADPRVPLIRAMTQRALIDREINQEIAFARLCTARYPTSVDNSRCQTEAAPDESWSCGSDPRISE